MVLIILEVGKIIKGMVKVNLKDPMVTTIKEVGKMILNMVKEKK
jgi:hypothetical protein